MMLYVNGQDIAALVLGLIDDDGWAVEPTVVAAPPEQYLASIDAFLQGHRTPRESITALAVVRGPGSATALRSSLSLANAWAFAQSLPIVPIEKLRDTPDADVLLSVRAASSVAMVTPHYEHSARITASTKDALGR